MRERENREKLWHAIADGTIDMVVSDHSPCTPALKLPDTGDFMGAWGGISALQFGLPVMWTNMRERSYTISDLNRLMSAGPASLAGLDTRKGKIATGFDADLVIWDPDASFTVRPEMIHHRHKVTPYDGMELMGRVHSTWVGGKLAYSDGEFAACKSGRLL